MAWIAVPPDLSIYLDAPSSPRLLDRGGKLLHARLAADHAWRMKTPLAAISPHLVHATLAAEDRNFHAHPGVDPLALVRAAWDALRTGRAKSGASTIPMQLAKRAGGSTRSVGGKLRQMVRALRLDAHASKDELLAAYLNTAPYGMNLSGCEAAARRYFGKSARELAVHEAALLAGLPNAPARFMPLKKRAAAHARRDYVLRRMRAEGYLSDAELRDALKEPVDVWWNDFPQDAPHLAASQTNHGGHGGINANSEDDDGGEVLETTLDSELQRQVQALLSKRVKALGPDITNAAAIVVDVPSGEVRAWVGSADFFATPGGGQVDLCRAVRSPGSALKPFLYALAMERSLLFPEELLCDNTWDAGKYLPEDFDREFLGLVPAGDALRRSLNIPALTVLERVGVPEFLKFLGGAGMTTLTRPQDDYGLGLTVGNCEARLCELAGSYAMLARMGEWLPPRWRKGAAPAPVRRLSAGVCLAMYQMLEQPLPNQADRALLVSNAQKPRVCWKTGTSAGNHDAWAFVFNARYVVAVWLGNNNAQPSPRLIGARVALPLAARLLDELPDAASAAWPAVPNALHAVRVCALSGLPAAADCPRSRETAAPAALLLDRTCSMHTRGADGALRTRWPASANRWNLAALANAGEQETAQSPLNESADLKILTPSAGAQYVLANPEEAQPIVLRSSAERGQPVHWYIDGRYLGAASGAAPMEWPLSPGKHNAACVAENGARDEIAFEVLTPRAGNAADS